ncbi:LOW QUALITY PROTEIN: putative bifunctional UDP-N-acetylglucosamine transferase and deubiquitinase ALG13 [Chanos chanos]|uniref:LOW QUALITY PROTEIN: putative bifunctional UDP-N-acetylglucosamine transferase and deubiquitinase ALG13 n=1 Tax=Chanos chanos TaxID=29144 RepID=A0AC58UVZ4_CHACN
MFFFVYTKSYEALHMYCLVYNYFTMQKALKKYFVNMDEYLASIGLYRKMMARDASCLFRAVSEQLYYSQNYHLKIRKDCVNFMRANRCNFEPFVEGSFEKYLERLEDPQETAGQVAIKALSLLYRRCFVIYRSPGKPPTEITEEDSLPKILLGCSNNGHYDLVYPRSYPADAAMCQSLLYELLYTRVFGIEEEELQVSLEMFRGGGRRCRNSMSVCSEEAGYDTPDDRGHREEWEIGGSVLSEDKVRLNHEEPKVLDGPAKLTLPYKALKALDPEVYRNVDFDVWHDSRKEMQKTDYMVFGGRQYFLGDKCQVRLDPKGKYYNAFIQEVGTHTSAVTVFIEELGEKHLVSLTNLKPVNPVPAWNITPNRKGAAYSRPEQYHGELDSELRGRRRFFKRPRGKEVLMAMSYGRPQGGLPPRLQPGPGPGSAPGPIPPVRPPPVGVHNPAAAPGGVPYEHYRPHSTPRPPRGYGPPRSDSARFLNRHHLIGPEVAYYPKRCYQSFDNYSFRSRRSRRQMHSVNKECQFSFVPEPGEETQDMEGTITFYEIEETDENTFPSLPQGQTVTNPIVSGATTYWVSRGPSPIPPSGKQPLTSSEEDPDDRSAGGDQGNVPVSVIDDSPDTGFQTPAMYTATESLANLTIQEGGSRSGSPQEGVATYSYSQQVVVKSSVISSSQVVNSAPAAIFTSNSSPSSGSSQTPPTPQSTPILTPGQPPPPHALGRPVLSMQFPGGCPWFVNELGEQVSLAPPPPYSYDPNGNDLPRDFKVLQYYFNLGVQCYQQTYWHSLVHMQQPYQQPCVDGQYQSFPTGPSTQDHTVPQSYPEPARAAGHAQGEIIPPNGTPLTVEHPPTTGPSGAVFYPLVQDQCSQVHPTYEPYLPVLSTTYHYLTPWTPGSAQPRPHTFCPSPSYPISYVTAPSHPAHFVSQNM